MDEKLREQGRKLVHRYHETGLAGMSAGEVRLLLSEKLVMLGSVSECCSKGQDLVKNIVLKRAIEADVTEISKAMDGFDRGIER